MTAEVISLAAERTLRQEYPDPYDRARAVAVSTYAEAIDQARERHVALDFEGARSHLARAREAVEVVFTHGGRSSAIGIATCIQMTTKLDGIESAIRCAEVTVPAVLATGKRKGKRAAAQ